MIRQAEGVVPDPSQTELVCLFEVANFMVQFHVGVSENRGASPKMDGENNGKPY